ncbi:hypothetical protein HG531_001822 [Fusarium graminearum]|nr:hypothetical protein HG531_001822 [Fusarium graminearum]
MHGALGLEFGGASSAELTIVGLVALAIVVVASGDELATLVTTSALFVPAEVNIKELLLILGLSGAVEVDGAAVLGLVGLVLRKSGVAILEVHDGNIVTRSSFKHGELRVLLKLVLVQNLLARVGRLARLGQNVLGDRVGKGRVGGIARDEATRVTHFTNHGAISSEFGGILNPGVSRNW